MPLKCRPRLYCSSLSHFHISTPDHIWRISTKVSQFQHKTRDFPLDMFSHLLEILFCLGGAQIDHAWGGGRRSVFTYISILHSFGFIRNINKKLKRKIQASGKEYRLINSYTLCNIIISSLAHYEFSWQWPVLFTHKLNRTLDRLCSQKGKVCLMSRPTDSDICVHTYTQLEYGKQRMC